MRRTETCLCLAVRLVCCACPNQHNQKIHPSFVLFCASQVVARAAASHRKRRWEWSVIKWGSTARASAKKRLKGARMVRLGV